jgi:transcriptional regulator with XRE-family HTH domain
MIKYNERLRHARKVVRGITQEKLSDLSNVGQGTISKIERGDQNDCFSIHDIELSKALSISPFWLRYGDEPMIGTETSSPHEPHDKLSNKDSAIENWNDRIRERMNELEVSQQDLGDNLGLSPGRVSHYLNGRREPDFETLALIIRELGLTADWVILGIRNRAKEVRVGSSGLNQDFNKLSPKDKSIINNAIGVLAIASEHDEY